MSTTKLAFTNRDGLKLAARLDSPTLDRPRAYVLFAHCFTCSKDLKAMARISDALTAEGFAVLRFDFTGLGQSEGEFVDTDFSSNVTDLVDAAGFLEREYESPAILIGHSLGGAAILQAAGRIESARAVATIGAPSDPTHVEKLLRNAKSEIERRGVAEVQLAGRTFKVKKEFLDDLRQSNMHAAISALRKPLLVMHAPLDATVGIENAARIFEAAKHPKSFIALDGADHLLMRRRDARFAGNMVAAWADRYLEGVDADEGVGTAHELQGANVLTRIGSSGFRTDIQAGKHMLVGDEPSSLGGTDAGASPYDLLLAALGACTTMTLRMYADRKSWPLEEVIVRLSHEKRHAEDCEDCEHKKGAKIDHIERLLDVRGPLDATQRQRLTEIANRCPVHRTLHSEIRIDTKLQSESDG